MRQTPRSDYLPVTGDIQSLPDEKCHSVLLHASTIKTDKTRIAPDADGSFLTLGNEVLWGFGGFLFNQLFVSQSVLIEVSNAREIQFYSLTPTDKQVLGFTIFFKDTEDK